MPTREKELIVEELTDKFSETKAAVLTDYCGLDVAQVTELRNQLREAGVDYKVVKNTLALLAAKNADFEEIEEYLTGPTAIAFSDEDPVAPAKVLVEFAKEHEELEIKGGLVEGDLIDLEQVKSLADIPPREVLIAQLLAKMKAPVNGLVNALNDPLQSLAYTLKAIKEDKEE
ncbi:50S ribosomal protein L10 [Fuchsiella alkaliacetigena]|uniref:50S ribosomal protein L10 n=1 Tax=Fuchsiella alkaliacetigena TaxID=957042 RepID=UPI00200B5C4D|nr:50S ribosomal protein L10 [Fuchsiella alkaliacetigena]MCK8825779.1 50S ribosomal protein L10 [Fuchsiella alkaliacetigena]